jgi:PAS domain S-box-containing protein
VKRLFHDILNDLTVAMGFVQAFLDEKIEPTRARWIEILRALEHADASMFELRAQTRAAGIPRTQSVLGAIVEGSPYAKILVDENGRITLVNAEAENLFGYAREEVLGRSVELLVPLRFKDAHPDLRHVYNQTPVARPMGAGRDLFGRRKDGTEFPIEIGLNPIMTDAGNFTLAAISDITERKRAEELRLLHAGMERHAAELEQLNRELAAASRFKTQFISTMSHELRTPLAAIIGATELLTKAQLPERERISASTIHESAEALFALIGSILDFSKIEAGRMDLVETRFEVEAVVESAVEVVAQLIRAKNVGLNTYVDPSITAVRGDRDRLRQILINLLANAAKFTDDGEIVVRVHPVGFDADRLIVRFEVQDTGEGIAPQDIPNLFEPFGQAGASRAKKLGGSGLGLSISKRLVELMGGEIGVSSEVGRGSLFWFTCAFDPEARSTDARATTIDGARGLIISADDTFAHVIGQYLAAWSLPCTYAKTSAETLAALQSADEVRWVAIVDDDAAEIGVTLAILKAIVPTRIIMVGADHALRKPVSRVRLLDAITGTLASAQGADTTPPAPPEPPPILPVNGSVLVAEDDARLQRLLQLQFEELGVPVTFVADGKAAIEAVQSHDFAMVLMDCQMPELDGLAATKAIRHAERSTSKHIAIAAMTANAFAEDRAACIAAGMDDYLAKPVRLADLRAIIERWSRSPA